jgi:hypothetical protein
MAPIEFEKLDWPATEETPSCKLTRATGQTSLQFLNPSVMYRRTEGQETRDRMERTAVGCYYRCYPGKAETFVALAWNNFHQVIPWKQAQINPRLAPKLPMVHGRANGRTLARAHTKKHRDS